MHFFKNPISKQKDIRANFPEEFSLYAVSRGKELQLVIQHYGTTITVERVTLTMGMSGSFTVGELSTKIKHSMFSLIADDDKTIEMVDPRRFAKWRLGDFSKHRGPDFVTEYAEFCQKLSSGIQHDKRLEKTMLSDLLLSQEYFNGCGNYLRAEILGRLDVNPFQPIVNLTLQEKFRLMELCKQCAEEAYELGGGQLMTFKNPHGTSASSFLEWKKFYKGKGMLSTTMHSGRTFWYDPKWSLFLPAQINVNIFH